LLAYVVIIQLRESYVRIKLFHFS